MLYLPAVSRPRSGPRIGVTHVARSTSNSCQAEPALVSRPEDLAIPVPTQEAPGTEQIPGTAVPVAVDGQLSADGKFRWSAGWGRWVPTGREDEPIDVGPLEWGPLMPDRLHPRGCWCADCWETGIRYADYAKTKRLREENGF